MKTLINKTNPQIRITAPEIESYREFYTLQDKDFHYLYKMEDWALVEEEPEVDLENEAVAFCFNNGINATPHQATRFAHHFYKLGLKARKKE